MNHRGVRKNVLRLLIVSVCLLILGAASWASSSFVAPQTPVRFHPRRPPANAQFVGDKVCATCHKALMAPHGQSAMAMAMEPVANSKVLSQNPSMTFRTGPYVYEIKRKGDASTYRVTDGQESITLPILYAFGQGKAGQTYMLQHDGGYYESLVSFYDEIKGLDFTIGASRTVPESLTKALGRRLSENEVGNCFSCHSTGGVTGGRVNPEKMVPGVRCEACHGPGAAHVDAVLAEKPSGKLIYNPARLSGDELTQDFCASCHRGTEEFGLLKSMEINNVRFQPYRIFHSKCYSDDRRISCTGCHNPHEPLQRSVSYYDSKCLVCHTPKEKVAKNETNAHANGSGVSCKVATKNCVSCHMPKTGPPAAHFKFTDHYIRIVKSTEAYPN